MAHDTPSRGGAKVASGLVGLLIGGLAAAFVVRTLLRDRDEIGDALAGASVGWLVLGLALAVLGMVAIALPWRRALNLLGADLPVGQLVARYFVGEIGKYLPGGVWPILGRGELARRRGVRRAAAYGSVALSLVALYLGAMFVVGAGLPTLLAGDDGTGPIAVLLLLPIGLLSLHPAVLGWGVATLERLTKRSLDLTIPSWRASVTLVALYVPAWLAIGGATWAVARSLDPSADLAARGRGRRAVLGDRLRAGPGAGRRRGARGRLRGGRRLPRSRHRGGHRPRGAGHVRRRRRPRGGDRFRRAAARR